NGSDDASNVGALELFLSRATKVLLWFITLLLVITLWDVLFGKSPLLGSFAPFPSLGTLFRSYFDGAGGSLLPGRSVAPPLDLILGLFGVVTLGFTGALQHLLLAAAIIGGAAGMYRVARRRSSSTAARLTTAVFLLLPLMSDLFVRGSYLMLLASTGLLPWLVLSFHRSLDAQRSSRRSKRRAYLGTGLFGALTLAVSPSVLLTFLLYGMAYAVMALVRGSRDSSRRAALALGVVVVSSVALDLPWSLSLLNPSVGMARLFGATPPHGLSVLKLLEFSTGQGTGGSLIVLGFLVFVLLAMSFVRGIRVTILGSLVIGYSFFLLFAAVDTSGIFGGSPLPLAAPMAMMAILLSQAVGVGVDALTQDLPRHRLSFRHVLGVVGALTLLVGTVGTLRPLTTARLGLPTAGFARSMSFVGSLPKNNSVLWLGDQSVLPVSGWKLTNGLSVALVSQAIPDVRSLYAPASYGDAAPLVRALRSAIAGNDVQLGSIFARYGVRYVVVPQPSTNPGFFVGTDLDLIFERQVDLRQLLVDPSVAAFEVTEPVRGYVGSTTLSSTMLRYFGLAVQLASLLLVMAAFFRRRAWLIRVDLPQIRVSRRTSSSSSAQSRGSSSTSRSSRSFDEDSSLGAEVTVVDPQTEPSTDESDGTCAEPGSGVDGEVVEASRVERGRSGQSSSSRQGYNEVSDE
ncbi:MAG: hypothetical protein ACP5O0_07590, partial [Acidimicrobiales bacterium]